MYANVAPHGCISEAIAVLEAQIDAPEPEPVAHVEVKHTIEARFHANCEYGCTLNDGDKLYLHSPAAREPLSEAEVDDLLKDWYPAIKFSEHVGLVRAVEAAVRARQ